MCRSTEILSAAIRTERANGEMPASQERGRLARLAAGGERCCRGSFLDRLRAALDVPMITITITGGIR